VKRISTVAEKTTSDEVVKGKSMAMAIAISTTFFQPRLASQSIITWGIWAISLDT